MPFLKNWLESIKNSKIKALFNDMTPIEYLLICVPFSLSSITFYGGFTIFIITLMMGLSLLFLFGLRWRIIYFIILLYLGIFLIFIIGKPEEFWLAADRDSAIRVGIEAILKGENPFKTKTNLGHSPTPLPFTYIFYLPVYLITAGHTSYMNLIVLSAFSITLFYRYVDSKQDYLILPIISFIMFSNYFYIELLNQSDLINSGLLLCMILLIIPDEIPKLKKFKKLKYITCIPEIPKKIDKKIVLFAIFFGCLLAMRIHLWLIVGIIPLYICKIYGIKKTIILGTLTISTFLIIMLPFVLQDLDFFIYVNPIAHNSLKFAIWRNNFKPFDPISYLTYLFVKTFFTYGKDNSIIISCLIISSSFLLGFIKCENKFHLMILITFCFLALLFFYFFGIYYAIIRDYISIPMIPFVFTFLYANLESNKNKIESKE